MAVTGAEFRPTHRAPAEGIATYPAPVRSSDAGPSLPADLDVQVLEQRADGWAHVGCSNGWTAWADGRLLVALPRFAPSDGLVTYATPDPSQPPGAPIGPGLEVSVVEQHDDGWAQVRCTNGWAAWVDGRLLQAASRSAPATSVPRHHAVPEGRVVAATLVGAGAIALGSFLPWLSAGPISLTSWRVPVEYLITQGSGDSVRAGPFVLGAAIAVVLVSIFIMSSARRPSAVLLLFAPAAVATNLGFGGLTAALHPAPHPTAGAGVYVTIAGGLLVGVLAYRQWQARGGSG